MAAATKAPHRGCSRGCLNQFPLYKRLPSVRPEELTQAPNRLIYRLVMSAKEGRRNPKVDRFLAEVEKWREEMEALRTLILACPLTEELKWGKPCYTFQESNIVIIQGFKESCALLFCKGALLKDAEGILEKPGENTQAARRVRFTSVGEIVELKSVLRAYIREALEAEKAGLEVDYKKTSDFKIPEEFQNKLNESRALKTAFHALTPGRQRAYLLHFSAPKQSKTRESRVEKCTEQILNGKGLNDE